MPGYVTKPYRSQERSDEVVVKPAAVATMIDFDRYFVGSFSPWLSTARTA